MMQKSLFLLLCVATSLFLSCERRSLRRQLNEFTAREIVINDQLTQVFMDRDSNLIDLKGGLIKSVIYIDPTSCSSCKIKAMHEYEEILRLSDETNKLYLPLFIFSPQRGRGIEVRQALKISNFNHPVLLDEKGSFPRVNPHIPQDQRFHAFLLDKNNKVVLVGDPTSSSVMLELYKKTIDQLIENGGTMP